MLVTLLLVMLAAQIKGVVFATTNRTLRLWFFWWWPIPRKAGFQPSLVMFIAIATRHVLRIITRETALLAVVSRSVLFLIGKNKIFRRIVASVPVYVMNKLTGVKKPTELFFNYQSVFRNVLIGRGWVIWAKQINISIARYSSSSPMGMLFRVKPEKRPSTFAAYLGLAGFLSTLRAIRHSLTIIVSAKKTQYLLL